MRALMLVAVLVAGAAYADAPKPEEPALVSPPDSHGSWVKITGKPCSDADVRRFIEVTERAGYYAAVFHFGERDYEACWKIDPNTSVLDLREMEDGALRFETAVKVVDSEGDVNYIPMHGFGPEKFDRLRDPLGHGRRGSP